MPNSTIDRRSIEQIVRRVIENSISGAASSNGAIEKPPELVVSISARHAHLTDEDVEILFGPGHRLTPMKDLYQEGFFAAEETVMVVGPRRRMLPNVRVLGPTRNYSQIEVAFTDAISLGIDAPVRASGKIEGTPGCVLVGPKGVVELSQGVIRAERHVHIHRKDLAQFGLESGGRAKLKITSPGCSVIFEDLLVRDDETSKLEVHIDTDEGNACHLDQATKVEIFGQEPACSCSH